MHNIVNYAIKSSEQVVGSHDMDRFRRLDCPFSMALNFLPVAHEKIPYPTLNHISKASFCLCPLRNSS